MLIIFRFLLKLENNMKAQHTDDDPIFVSHYDSDALHEMLDTQHKKTEHSKNNTIKKYFQLSLIINEFADDPSCTRQSKMLHALYLRGRHNMISTITIQKFNAIHRVIRVHATTLILKLLSMRRRQFWIRSHYLTYVT